MNSKRKTALIIPFDHSDEDTKKYAKQHWNITFGRQQKVSVYAKRIMSIVLGKIKDDDLDFKPIYYIKASSLSNNTEIVDYAYIKKAFDELTDLKWLIEDIDKKRFAYRHLINTTHADCGYDNGTISIALNPLLKDYFIALTHYSTYDLAYYMTFKSWYSMRLFELLSAFKDTGVWEVDIDEFRQLMDCENKYKKDADMLKYVLKEPLHELNITNVGFELEYVKHSKGRGRPAIVGLKFILKSGKSAAGKVANLVKKHPHLKAPFDDLIQNWEITNESIVKYAPVFGAHGIDKLLKRFREIRMQKSTQGNKSPIKNKKSYYNELMRLEAEKKAEFERKKKQQAISFD